MRRRPAILDEQCPVADEAINLRQVAPFRYVDGITRWNEAMTAMTGWVRLGASERRLFSPAATSALLVEALAQLSGALLRMRTPGRNGGGVLASIENAVFSERPLGPQPVVLKTRITRDADPYFMLEAVARQRGHVLGICVISVRSLQRKELDT